MSWFKHQKEACVDAINITDDTSTKNHCTTVYQTVNSSTEDVSERETIRKWYEKQAENSLSERWGPEKLIIFCILLAVAIVAAYAATDARLVVASVLLFVGWSVGADPLKLTRRRVAKESRILLAVGVLPLSVIVIAPSVRAGLVALGILIVLTIIAAVGNEHWLSAKSYRMSRHVLKALKPESEIDNKDACFLSWQADGAREVVAAAAEMGAYSASEIEWAVRKAAYTIGFCRASTISRKHERERTKALRDAEDAKAEAAELRERLEAVTDYVTAHDKYCEKLAHAELMAKRQAETEKRLMDAGEENRKLRATIERLEAANDELVKTADNPLLAADVAEAETERRLKEAAEKGLSVRQTEAYAGVSHRRAQEYLAANRKKAEGKE